MNVKKVSSCLFFLVLLFLLFNSCATEKEAYITAAVYADPIYVAAREGNLEEIRRLLKSGTDVNITSEYLGRTALHWAVQSKHKDVVELLISSGASIDVKAKDNRTPLHFAAEHGPKDIAELLIEGGADIEAAGNGKLISSGDRK